MKQKSKILPPTYFYTLLIFLIIFHFIFPLIYFIKPPLSYLGVIPIILGILINILTDNLFKKKETTVKPYEKPSKLIVEGPFRFSRHPMYLGMILILVGIAIFLGSIITVIFPITFFLLMEIIFIPHEEKQMQKQFKNEYNSYKKKVRKWI